MVYTPGAPPIRRQKEFKTGNIVTGDADLLVLKQIDSLKIVTAREFLARLGN